MKNNIPNNLKDILNRIAIACKNANRDPEAVKLLMATKTVSAENIKIAFESNQTLIGENKIQEIKEKYDSLKSVKHEKHFIGHLQTNKVKELLRYDVDCIQSLDRLRLAEKLQNRLEYEDKTIDAYLQFNTSYEDSKFGMKPENALTFALAVQKLDRINIKGLMTIGLFSAEDDKVRKCFKLLKNIQKELLENGIPAHELSMGMSGDLEIAIEEGATIIRVGTAIFGKREHPDSYYWNEGL
ncbi:YggS family pyridoxal phosphate-dependent enzyme [Bizionia argentinensis JUB59]|uniref:Pyridoxal phosphate homeostasis protein n=1 Tax=Bizionia argentinensis JUB59 TaxID=1046627 RepID=G2EBU3_9FLAO|nr:YggS family pyridoxal phosphate-dependent enzyme [Bizionia argentinensis]EGV44105.1 YggS family pyridoxal phosphate-dependent enzyme [Bizionia argentinensis JUB59]